MKNHKSKIGKYLYDHWLVVFAFLLAIGGVALLENVRNIIIAVVSWRYSGWIVAIILVAIWLLTENRKKSHTDMAGFVPVAPIYKHEEFNPIKQYGVFWSFWRGNNTPSAFDYALGGAPLKGWVDGPFCPECDYELEKNTKGTKWVCIKCKSNFSIPADIRSNTKDKLIKIFEADFRKSGRLDAK